MEDQLFVRKTAVLSPCKNYRYQLTREWGSGSVVNFVMLNPSTADADTDDHTIRKCMGFARRWGCDGIHVYNLFALRSTDPDNLYGHPDPIGPDNDEHLRHAAMCGHPTIFAWGRHGQLRGRAAKVAPMFADARVIKRNLDGSPMHPLMAGYDNKLTVWMGRKTA